MIKIFDEKEKNQLKEILSKRYKSIFNNGFNFLDEGILSVNTEDKSKSTHYMDLFRRSPMRKLRRHRIKQEVA